MPAYNDEKYIVEAIESVLRQTYQSFELIVVDDGSTDGTPGILARYKDNPKIKVVRQQNGGTASARNAGIKNATGEYIAFLDSDDKYTENRLRLIADYIENHPDTQCLATNVVILNEKGISSPIIDDISGELSRQGLRLYDGVIFCSLNIHASILAKIGLFDTGFYYIEDVEMWHRIHAYGYSVSFINDCSYLYRRYGDINKTSSKNSKKIQMDVIKINKKYLFYKQTPLLMRLRCLRALLGNIRKYVLTHRFK